MACTSEILSSSPEGQPPTQHATSGLLESRPAAPDCSHKRLWATDLATERTCITALYDSPQARASATEAEVVLPAQACAAETALPGEEGQGRAACNLHSTLVDDAGQLQQSDPQPSEQQRPADLRGTLSHQIQVSHSNNGESLLELER